MTFPSGPEFEGYRQLCRDLRLEREFEEGNWYLRPLVGGEDYSTVAGAAMAGVRAEGRHVWLPRLDQLVAMLKDAGVAGVDLHLGPEPLASIHRYGKHAATERELRVLVELQAASPASLEEACLRLWLAVTGRADQP